MELGKLVGKRIQELLFYNDLSVYRLSKMTKLSEQTISNLIKGFTKDVRLSTIYIICKALNVDILEFLSPNYFRNDKVLI